MPKILIVDDDPKVRKIYHDLLASESYEVIEAKNGEWADDLLHQNEIDLVLLDIHMPAINGLPLFNIIRQESPRSKVLITSAYLIEDQEIMIKGADGYFCKSEGAGKLIWRVRKILSKKAPKPTPQLAA